MDSIQSGFNVLSRFLTVERKEVVNNGHIGLKLQVFKNNLQVWSQRTEIRAEYFHELLYERQRNSLSFDSRKEIMFRTLVAAVLVTMFFHQDQNVRK
jgi:hypothetical protein